MAAPHPVERTFYDRPVVDVARALIGATITHGGASGVIVETEAYHESEPACHGFIGTRPRTRVLFGPPGHAYVYRSYGIHALVNAVCEPEGVGAAVLIRALHPTVGLGLMRARRGVCAETALCSGPGKLTQALAIGLDHNGVDLTPAQSAPEIEIRPGDGDYEVIATPRIGISKATELPWRFCAVGVPSVSRPRPKL